LKHRSTTVALSCSTDTIETSTGWTVTLLVGPSGSLPLAPTAFRERSRRSPTPESQRRGRRRPSPEGLASTPDGATHTVGRLPSDDGRPQQARGRRGESPGSFESSARGQPRVPRTRRA